MGPRNMEGMTLLTSVCKWWNTLKGSLWWCESQAHIYAKYTGTELEKGEKEITDGRKGSQRL